MASMLISNYMMFLPEATKWFCLIGMCIVVFGIWIPYEEHKKKKKQQQKNRPKKPDRVEYTGPDRNKLEQLKALKKAGLLSEEEYQEKKRGL